MERLLDAVTAAVIIFHEHRLIFANAAAEALFGIQDDEIATLTLNDILCPEFAAAVTDHLAAHVPVTRLDIMLKTAAGCAVWVEFSTQPTQLDGQDVWLATLVDITARKQTEIALRESEHRFKGAFEHSGIGMALVSPEGKWLKVNRRIVDMLGYSEEELYATNFQQLTHPDDLGLDLQHVEQMLRGEIDSFQMEKRYFAKDGRIIWALLNVSLVRDTVDKPLYFVSQVADITARKQLEAALYDINQRYDDLVAHIPAMVYRYRDLPDGSFRFDYVSPRARDLLGLEPEVVLQNAQLLINLVHPDDRADFWNTSNESLRAFKAFIWEGRFLKVSGDLRWIRLESYPRRLNDGSVIWDGIHIDITAQKQAEAVLQEQERLRIALQKEQELSDLKTRMMIHISHEFRTPLSVIATSADMLARYHERMTAGQREERFQQIRLQIEHLTEMLDDVAYLVHGNLRQTVIEPNEHNLKQLCQDVIDKLASRLDGHAILFDIADGLSEVILDGMLVKRILLNLLTNALKYSPGRTSVWLDVYTEGSWLVLRVRDQGIGIPLADQARLFEPFYRGSNIGSIGGLGLGLSIVQQAVTLHGGSIAVESAQGQGTTFTVTLPYLTNSPSD